MAPWSFQASLLCELQVQGRDLVSTGLISYHLLLLLHLILPSTVPVSPANLNLGNHPHVLHQKVRFLLPFPIAPWRQTLRYYGFSVFCFPFWVWEISLFTHFGKVYFLFLLLYRRLKFIHYLLVNYHWEPHMNQHIAGIQEAMEKTGAGVFLPPCEAPSGDAEDRL